MKKTKIIATMGPAINDKEILKELINKGLNVVRLNFSHANEENSRPIVKMLREVNQELNTYVPWLCDTKGPEIRVGVIENDVIHVNKGDLINIHMQEIVGNQENISVTYPELIDCVSLNDTILIDDGLLGLKVIGKKDGIIETKVINSGDISSRKGVNVPGVVLEMPYLSEKDIADITYACQDNATYIATSFTRRASDVLQVRELCQQLNREDMQIIAKIENQEGLDNLDAIIEASDGIMVARGDLGTEIPMEDVPLAQIEICHKCNVAGKPVIIATHMLDSMERNARPTRAEVGDVSRAVSDGADAVMLSGESAKGEYPVEAVDAMARIVKRSEEVLDHNKIIKKFMDTQIINEYDGVGIAVVELATTLKAKAIFCFTDSGATAREISKLRPECPIYALTRFENTIYGLALNWGVIGLKQDLYASIEVKDQIADNLARQLNFNSGDYVIVTGGHPDSETTTNFLKILKIK